MSDTPNWRISGDWFDNCSCAVACPCTFGQAPDNNFCEHVLFWHIREGHFGDVELNDLCVVQVGSFDGNLWDYDARGRAGIVISVAMSAGGGRKSESSLRGARSFSALNEPR
jgi:hypothetical protein